MLIVISLSKSEESKEFVLESELSLDEVSEKESEFKSESTVARLTLPFLDFLLFFFFFWGYLRELWSALLQLEHFYFEDNFLIAYLIVVFITLFSVNPAKLSEILFIGS